MPDITKCDPEYADECPQKNECYRQTAPADKSQSTCTFRTDFSVDRECDWFLPIEDTKP